jgi:hypothetical protein
MAHTAALSGLVRLHLGGATKSTIATTGRAEASEPWCRQPIEKACVYTATLPLMVQPGTAVPD